MMDLPLDIGVFSTIIENNYKYVDKTKFIYELYRPGGKYFLSRPRRFGKSLLVDTMVELFKGNKSLFEGLYIYDKWDWTKSFPVIGFDLGNVSKNSPEIFEDSLNTYILRIARNYQIELISNDLTGRFSELIQEIYKSTDEKIVVLVDEYDKPIIDNINDYDVAEGNRKVLSNFYGVLKSNEKFIEFIFLTGVSKFSKTSIFSGLNNVTDITINSKFANICGYTQEDLEACFSKYLDDFSKEYDISCDELLDLIKGWYNGYSWDGVNRLYNPYSILSLLAKGEFGNFWFETGTPTFLMDFVKKNKRVNVLFKPHPTISGDFPNFNLNNLDFTTLLLQTGYLTIKSKKTVVGELNTYELAIPNREVSESLFKSIINEFTDVDDDDFKGLERMILNSFINLDNESLQDALDILLSTIPSSIYGKIKDEILEANYYMLFLSILKYMGFFVVGETPFSRGTPDIILKKDNLVVVCELKYSQTEDLNDLAIKAIDQIKKKEYYKPYLNYNVVLLGIAFGNREAKSLLESLKN
ncbi:MAG: ATP-binding protein [Methanobrevibacter sp.]|nr:ATP-binding protein [Methanobrevibacter sp.]